MASDNLEHLCTNRDCQNGSAHLEASVQTVKMASAHLEASVQTETVKMASAHLELMQQDLSRNENNSKFVHLYVVHHNNRD